MPRCVLFGGASAVGTRLAAGAAHGQGFAATTVAKTIAMISKRMLIADAGLKRGGACQCEEEPRSRTTNAGSYDFSTF